ncbi:hypothetical protein JM36_14670 [Salmonella enterica]|nr:hypothetical protein JM36_14670 [Salmonella enterica]
MSSNDVLQKVKRIYNANRAGMPGAVGIVDALNFLQHVIAGHTLRLIQQQNAVNVAATTTRTTHQSSLLSSGFTRRSSSCFTTLVTRLDIRIPSTSELS